MLLYDIILPCKSREREKENEETVFPCTGAKKKRQSTESRTFRFKKYITRLSEEYPAVTTHWHEEAELTLIVKGKCHYHVDLVDYEVKEGDLLFVPPLFLHAISKGRCEEFISETYVFHLNFLGGNSTDICSTRYLVPIMNQEFAMPCLITGKHLVYASLRKVFDQITSLYDENVDGYELALKALLFASNFFVAAI